MPHEPELSRQCLAAIPPGDAPWDRIFWFLSDFSQEIDGYTYGDARGGFQRFLEEAERRFLETGELSDSVRELLVLAYLIFRRDYWTSWSGDEIEKHRRFMAALLEKARQIVRVSPEL